MMLYYRCTLMYQEIKEKVEIEKGWNSYSGLLTNSSFVNDRLILS